MKYFVTGATGFIGGKLARRLAQEGHEVIALVRTPSKAADLAAAGIHLVQGDITDKESMRGPIQGVDGVFHIAAWYQIGQRDSSMARGINVEGTRNVLELMKEYNIPKGVYTSTLAVFSDTKGHMMTENDMPAIDRFLSVYEQTKWEAHYQVALPMMDSGLPLVVVMPGVVYGPGDQSEMRGVMVQYLQRKFPMTPKGWAVCWSHVDDIVEGHLLAMDKGKVGESYIIAGEPKSVEAVFDLAESITGIPAPAIKAPPALFKGLAGVVGVLEKVIPMPGAYSSEGLKSVAGTTYWGDNSKAKRELGYHPRPLTEGLPDTLAYEMQLLGITPRK